MSGIEKYLIDTNILIYFFDGKFSKTQKERVISIFEQSFNISIISKLGDAIIGTTALMNDFILVTRNQKDFEKINGLKILNPCDEKIENIK